MLGRCSRRALSSKVAAPRGPRDAVIVSAARTPIGSFQGALASVSATDLGAVAVREAVRRAGLKQPDLVEEVYFGNVVQANVGQAPARQVALKAGLAVSSRCTTINKVCSSGLKSVALAAMTVQSGNGDCLVAGGTESMSQIPYYLPGGRSGFRMGHAQVVDGVLRDALWDSTDDQHMGSCAEVCAAEYKISREQQDDYALESYRRAAEAWAAGRFDAEVVPVEVRDKKGAPAPVRRDEEPTRLQADRVRTLRPAFKKDGGTVTAINASSLNDGAAALVVTSRAFAERHGLRPIATVLGYADAEKRPVEFTTAPSAAIPAALARAGIAAKDVDYFEINEAFAAVAIANQRILGLDPARLNAFGGAVALGHPVGASGARILVTLLSVLRHNNGRVGVAGICNGGGGASALVVRLED